MSSFLCGAAKSQLQQEVEKLQKENEQLRKENQANDVSIRLLQRKLQDLGAAPALQVETHEPRKDKPLIASLKNTAVGHKHLSEAAHMVNSQGLDLSRLADVSSDTVYVIAQVREALAPARDTIRSVFKSLDSSSYGYIPRDKFIEALEVHAHVHLDEVQKRILCDFADKDGDGNLDYTEFYNAFFKDHIDLNDEQDTTLTQIIMITRHGARFPLKPFPLNTAWPNGQEFWDRYGGNLTPTGQQQHTSLGKMVHKKYIEKDGLLDTHDPDVTDQLYCFSSNSDRTMGSAQGFLMGFIPDLPKNYAIEGEENSTAQGHQGVDILLADMSRPYTPLLHGFKLNKAYDKLKKKIWKETDVWDKFLEDPEIQRVLQKLWEMTEFDKISPSLKPQERIQHFQSVAQQIGIERAHGMQIFANRKKLIMEDKDETQVRRVADTVCRMRYCGHTEQHQRVLARLATGVLPMEIIRNFRKAISGESKRRFCLYSAHDNTLMALLSHMGFRNWEVPQFAAYMLFELHASGEAKALPYVKFAYNFDPSKVPVASQLYLRMPSDFGIVDIAQADQGYHSLAEFEDILLNQRKSFQSVAEWGEASLAQDEFTKQLVHLTAEDLAKPFKVPKKGDDM